MAQKRMFDIDVIDSDFFLDMPLSTQLFYFHLGMRADDEGFIGNPKRLMKMIGFSDDDLRILISKGFVRGFESGVVVIIHWHQNNYLRTTRIKLSKYHKERSLLALNEQNEYIKNIEVEQINGDCTTHVQHMYGNGTDSIEENRREENSKDISVELQTTVSELHEMILKYHEQNKDYDTITVSQRFNKQQAMNKLKIIYKNDGSIEKVLKGYRNYLLLNLQKNNDIQFLMKIETFLTYQNKTWLDFYEITDDEIKQLKNNGNAKVNKSSRRTEQIPNFDENQDVSDEEKEEFTKIMEELKNKDRRINDD